MRPMLFMLAGWLLGAWAGPSHAQPADQLVRQHRYTEAIDAVRRTDARLDQYEAAALSVLGVAHLRRGYLLRNLKALQVEIGVRYYTGRLQGDLGTPGPWTGYFLGRYLFEQGRPEEALRLFVAAGRQDRLPPAYRQRARLWAAACQARLGHQHAATAAWAEVPPEDDAALAGERAYARWQAGYDEPPACPAGPDASAAALRCTLWAALRAQDLTALRLPQQRLLAHDVPDQQALVRAGLSLRFYDPATLDMLAAADFTAAFAAFRRLAETEADAWLYAGLSAFEAGFPGEARAALAQSTDPLRAVYLGALAFLDGRTDEAQRNWQRARAAGPEAEIEWAFVASRFPGTQRDVRDAARRLRRAAAQNQRAAHKLGRALLQAGQPAEALRLLEDAYPHPYHNQLDHVEPGFLATLAHARFLGGRADYPALRSHLASLQAAFPVAAGVLYLAQAQTLPQRRASFNKRTGR